MIVVILKERGKTPREFKFNQSYVSIGRLNDNDIVLLKGHVSKTHARISKSATGLIVMDTGSTNGTFVNGKKIEGPWELASGDKITISDFELEVYEDHLQRANLAAEGKVEEEAKQRDSTETRLVATREISPQESELLISSAPGPQKERHVVAYSEQEVPHHQAKQAAPPNESQQEYTQAHVVPSPTFLKKDSVFGVTEKLTPMQTVAYLHEVLGDLAKEEIEALATQNSVLKDNKAASKQRQEKMKEAALGVLENLSRQQALASQFDENEVIRVFLSEIYSTGPLESLLSDSSVTEVLVNGPNMLYVERKGKLEKIDKAFSCDQAVLHCVRRWCKPLGRRIDVQFPMVDGRLKDGSRLNAVIPPLSIKGPHVTIRKFMAKRATMDDLVGYGSVSPEMAEFLEVCVEARKNILISGGTGAGKTTLLNVMANFIDEGERIVTIEDAAELKLPQEHVVTLEARVSDQSGNQVVTIRDLVKNALRMRPDRIVVGECRGGEALDMLQAMNTGHDGSMTTIHANNTRDALARLETLVLMAGMDLPAKNIREQIVGAIAIIVQQSRYADGTRKISAVSEITGMEVDKISMHDIFVFEQQGFSPEGQIRGAFKATGIVPKFYDHLRRAGFKVNLGIFKKTPS
jgi:pilus assembly protein CpaF